MQTSMEHGILSDPFQSKPEMAFFSCDFLISDDVLVGTLWVRSNMEISKSAVLLANEH